MAKRKTKKEYGVKSLKLPAILAYFVAGCGVIVIIVFVGYLLVGSFAKKAEEEKKIAPETVVWTQRANEWKSSGTLISFTKDTNEDGIAVVHREKWDKLPFDSKEALAIAVSRANDIKTLQVKDETGAPLGICRYGVRLRENK